MSFRIRIARPLVATAVVAFGLACSGGESPGPGGSTQPPLGEELYVTLSVDRDSMAIGESRQLDARVHTAANHPRIANITWSSANSLVATVSASGLVTAVAEGIAPIVASVGARSDTAMIEVRGLALTVVPELANVVLGDSLQMIATTPSAAAGGSASAAMSGLTVTWSSSDESIASVSADGLVTTHGEGDADLIATVNGASARASVSVKRMPVAAVVLSPANNVTYVGKSVTLTALALDVNGRSVPNADILFSSSNEAVARVSATGVVTGVSAGGAIIKARSQGKNASASINVLGAPASSIVVQLAQSSLTVGQTTTATASLLNEVGSQMNSTTRVAWQSSNPAVATVTPTGTVSAVATGTSTISAIADGKSAGAPLTVSVPVVSTVTITPATAAVRQGGSTQLSVELRDQNGNVLSRPVTWSSADPSIASVGSNGTVQGVALGTTVITATASGKSGTATVNVTPVPVASVVVSPSSAQLQVGKTAQLTATARDASGATLGGRVASWSSSEPAVASVSPTGVVTGTGAGSATITATIEGVTASAAVSVAAPPPAPVASVTITLNSSTVVAGNSVQAVATLKDAAGNTLTGRTVTWATDDATLATVSSTGLVSAKAAGTVTVEATAEGKVGLATLTIQAPPPAPVASVVLTATSTNLQVGETTPTTVTLYDAAGNVLTGRTIGWSSSNSGIAKVNLSGVITAVASGTATITASSGTKSGSVTIAVTAAPPPPPAPVASVTVSASPSTLTIGQSVQASATLKDAAGNVLTGRTITWSSSAASVASVSPGGSVTAITPGTATISATSEGKSGSVTITTTPVAVASVTVSVNPSTFAVGQTAIATATAKDAAGNTITGRAPQWVSSDPSVASVTQLGQVTGVSAGTATITGTIDGKSAQKNVTVTAPTTPPPPGGTPGVTLPALPQILSFSYPRVTGRTITVRAGDNLQTAIDNAQRGDEIVIEAGATFSGTFTLRAKSGTAANGWIIIRSSALGSLPSAGTRVTPAHAGSMPKIVTPNYAAAIKTEDRASGWWLAGLEVTVSGAFTGQQYGLVTLGDGGGGQNTLADVPSDLVLERMYIHGQTNTNGSRCIALNSARTAIVDSYVHECHGKSFDSQAIAGWNGPGPYKIVNNTLAGAGENVMFGGADPAISGLIPSDIEIRGNYLYTPPSWKGVWQKKNLFETKNAQRVLLEGNVLDGSWIDGQTGWAVILKSANQSGRCTWCKSADITLRYNVIRNAGAGINLAGREGTNPNPVGANLARVLVENNILEDIHTGIYSGDARMVMLINGSSDITIRRNTMTAPGSLNTFLVLGRGAVTNLAYQDNIVSKGTYGMTGDGQGEGAIALKNVTGTATYSNVAVIGTAKSGYPSTTQFVGSLSAALGVPNAGANTAMVNSMTQKAVIP